MSNWRYLLRRGLRWYFRLHVPSELQSFIGRDELRKSLRTSCCPVAKEAMRSELFRGDEDGEHMVTSTDGQELHLYEMIRDFATGKYHSNQPVADAILEEAGITLEKSSKGYQRILRETLKGAIAVTRTELQRLHGRYDEEEAAPRNGTEASKQTKAKGVLLSVVVNEYGKVGPVYHRRDVEMGRFVKLPRQSKMEKLP